MKKVLATILAVIYLTTTSGAVINMHYCMGKMYAFGLSKKDNCSKCGMKKAKSCCNDEVKIIKIQDTHHSVSETALYQPYFASLQKEYNISNTVLQAVAPAFAANNNSPPGSNKVPLYIAHCIFRV